MKFIIKETFAKKSYLEESDSEQQESNTTEFHLDFLDQLDQEIEKNPLTEQQRSEAKAFEDRSRVRMLATEKLRKMNTESKNDPRLIPLKKSIKKSSLDLRFLKPMDQSMNKSQRSGPKLPSSIIQKIKQNQKGGKNGILKQSSEFSRFGNDEVSLYTNDQTATFNCQNDILNNEDTHQTSDLVDEADNQTSKTNGFSPLELNLNNVMNYSEQFLPSGYYNENDQNNKSYVFHKQPPVQQLHQNNNDEYRKLIQRELPDKTQIYRDASGKTTEIHIHQCQQNFYINMNQQPHGSNLTKPQGDNSMTTQTQESSSNFDMSMKTSPRY